MSCSSTLKIAHTDTVFAKQKTTDIPPFNFLQDSSAEVFSSQDLSKMDFSNRGILLADQIIREIVAFVSVHIYTSWGIKVSSTESV